MSKKLEDFILHVIFWASYGVSLHDFAHQVYELKGTVFGIEGGYVGFFFLALTGIVLLYRRYAAYLLKTLRK